METMVVGISRWRVILWLIVSLGLVAAGLLVPLGINEFSPSWRTTIGIIVGDNEEAHNIASLVCSFLFGLGSAKLVWELISNRPCIIVDQRGVYKRFGGELTVDWDDIERASIRKYEIDLAPLRYLIVHVTKPNKYKKKLSWFTRISSYTPVCMALALAAVDTDELLRVIHHNIEEHKKQRPAA